MEVPDVKYIEVFHLLFLDSLGKRIDKKFYALKGGCNLRFFLKSIRYSQDLDLDIQIINKHTLEKAVNLILDSLQFKLLLASKQIEIQRISFLKQTETTQRWKINLLILPSETMLNTKIEFSRRGLDDEILFGPIDSMITRLYSLTPILVNHYSFDAAFRQKVQALISRSYTQARDIFDLYHLLNCGIHPKLDITQKNLALAKEHAFQVGFADFCSQVLSFLPFEYHKIYNNSKMWDEIVLRVVEALSNANN